MVVGWQWLIIIIKKNIRTKSKSAFIPQIFSIFVIFSIGYKIDQDAGINLI